MVESSVMIVSFKVVKVGIVDFVCVWYRVNELEELSRRCVLQEDTCVIF